MTGGVMTYLQKLRGGYVITDLVGWEFEGNKQAISHISEQIAKALVISYNMGNFGPDSFSFVKPGEDDPNDL
jgi:hypothetical protein